MEKKYLIVNRGSASEKYAIYTNEKRLAFIHLEKSETGDTFVSTLFLDGKKEEKAVTEKEYKNALNYSLDIFTKVGVISNKSEISGIGIRIVAPGKHFQENKIIDETYEGEIKKVIHDAPLHILPTYELILSLKKVFKNIPIVGVSDSDFHKTIPAKAANYALPFDDVLKYQLKRYGYHGTSVKSVFNKLKTEGLVPEKLIICHIGSGVSITAIKNGESIENSMGYTPLEGVMMATRGGNIDPGVVALISDSLGFFKGNKLKEYLNKKCGLLGVSGQSSDVRDLIKLEKEGDAQSKLALDMYVYQIQKCIGSYFAVLGGLDTLVFTATVGERSFIMRERICQGLSALGININKEINNQSEGIDADIGFSDSKVKVLVRKTDEMSQMAKDTVSVLNF